MFFRVPPLTPVCGVLMCRACEGRLLREEGLFSHGLGEVCIVGCVGHDEYHLVLILALFELGVLLRGRDVMVGLEMPRMLRPVWRLHFGKA